MEGLGEPRAYGAVGRRKPLGIGSHPAFVAFLRIKRIRGRDYAYLVESRWDAERRTSRQVTLQYVGPAEGIRLEDVPVEYRDGRARAFVLQHSAKAESRRLETVANLRERLQAALVEGERVRTSLVAEEALRTVGLDTFYVEILTPVMHAIGELWRQGDLTVSMEHLASNIVRELLDSLNARIRVTRPPRGTAVLCTPQGEMHALAAKVLEGLLLQRGFRSWNIAASAPTDSITDFIVAKKPDLVLVSLTIPQYVPSLKRLLMALRDRKARGQILVGGQGVRRLSAGDFPGRVAVVSDGSLAALDEACGFQTTSS